RLRAHTGAARPALEGGAPKACEAGAYGNGSAAPVRGAAARRAPHALGFPARARWRVEELGDSERAEPGGRRAEDGRPDRGPPARLRGVRGRDSAGRVWRGNRRRLGPRLLAADRRSAAWPRFGQARLHAVRREAARALPSRADEA